MLHSNNEYTISQKDWRKYTDIIDDLDSIRVSDVKVLSEIWKRNYDEILIIGELKSDIFFKRIITHKDFLKEKCKNNTMEDYFSLQVSRKGKSVYREVWRKQLKILINDLDKDGGVVNIGKIDSLQRRVWVYDVEETFFEKNKGWVSIFVFDNCFEICNGGFVVTKFDELNPCIEYLYKILIEEMQANPWEFCF